MEGSLNSTFPQHKRYSYPLTILLLVLSIQSRTALKELGQLIKFARKNPENS